MTVHPAVSRPDRANLLAPLAIGRPATDAELLAHCRTGDAKAWDLLVNRYERLVYSVALRNGLGVEDAADVCQTTFMALLESIDQVNAEDRLASWLMTVARRQAWRIRRRRGQEHPVATMAELSELSGSTGFGQIDDDPMISWERTAALHHALGQIPDPCRSLLQALYFDATNPSYAAIAERLGRTVGGIGPMRGRCLERLRALLGEDEDC